MSACVVLNYRYCNLVQFLKVAWFFFYRPIMLGQHTQMSLVSTRLGLKWSHGLLLNKTCFKPVLVIYSLQRRIRTRNEACVPHACIIWPRTNVYNLAAISQLLCLKCAWKISSHLCRKTGFWWRRRQPELQPGAFYCLSHNDNANQVSEKLVICYGNKVCVSVLTNVERLFD